MTKKFRAAVIGSTGRGDYGHGLDVVWLEFPEVELVAVADDDKAGLAAAMKRLNVARGYTDYRRMLDEVKPDVVSICPRWIDQHHDMIVAAAQRGIHVYVEKPFCRTLAEADSIIAECERTHTRLAIAHQTRYSPKARVVRELIESGKLGRVLELRGRGKEDARGGGEDLWVLGTHVMDLIRLFAGHPQWCFGNVTREGRPVTREDVIEGNEGIGPLAGDAVRAMYAMEGGATAYFSSHRQAAGRPSRFGLQIYGTGGVVEILTGHLPSVKFLPDPSWSPGRSGISWQDVSSQGVGLSEPLSDGGLAAGNVLAVRDLLAAIEEHREPLGNMYEARGATEMIVAVFESHRLGRPVPLPLENRENPLAMLS
jgi:predicted dehydrogenase